MGRTFTWPPDCMKYMDVAEVSCYPLSRVPKCSTATGLPTGKGRLIADLSWEGDDGWSTNGLTMLSVYGSFNMPRHADIARTVLSLAFWFPWVQLLMCKEDVSGAFRRKWWAVTSFGLVATMIAGHTLLEASGVFGHNMQPVSYGVSSESISIAHNSEGLRLFGSELDGYRYPLTAEERLLGIVVPFLSHTYCDDGMLLALKVQRYMKESKDWYDRLIRTSLGEDAVSTKDPEEREWTTSKTTIGHLLELDGTPDATGNKFFYSPTDERQAKTSRVTWQECFDQDKRFMLTARKCTEALHTWLWQGIVCPLLRPFIACFKRPLEGRLVDQMDEVVSPVRKGEGADAEEEFQNDMINIFLKYK